MNCGVEGSVIGGWVAVGDHSWAAIDLESIGGRWACEEGIRPGDGRGSRLGEGDEMVGTAEVNTDARGFPASSAKRLRLRSRESSQPMEERTRAVECRGCAQISKNARSLKIGRKNPSHRQFTTTTRKKR